MLLTVYERRMSEEQQKHLNAVSNFLQVDVTGPTLLA